MAIEGISVPDTRLAREITELVRDTESDLLFHHSSRVCYFGAIAGRKRGLHFDPELLYAGVMFHDMGLTHRRSSQGERFEVDGANATRGFLRGTRRVAAGPRHCLDRDCASHDAGHPEAHAPGGRPRRRRR